MAPEPLKVPLPHGVQLGASVVLENVPAPQGKHVVVFVASVVHALPAKQVEPLPAAEHWEEPAVDTRAPAHGVQASADLAPMLGLKVLAGQAVGLEELLGQK